MLSHMTQILSKLPRSPLSNNLLKMMLKSSLLKKEKTKILTKSKLKIRAEGKVILMR